LVRTLPAFLLGLAPLLGVFAPALSAQVPTGSAKGPSYTKDIRPLLKSYCFECHNAKKKKGELDLEKFAGEADALEWTELWDTVGERLRSKEMPPPKNPQPTAAQRELLLAWVAKAAQFQVSCDKITPEQREKSVAGYTMTRRLNRVEYNNTVRDLVGFDVRPGDLLPSEAGGGEGFDNTGATLFLTPAHLEKYLEAAELVVSALLPADPAKAPKVDPARLQAARQRLLVAKPGPDLAPRDAARKILTSFMARAFRRPATDKEIDRYLTLFDKANQRGDSFEQSLRLAVKGLLVSPHFLFLVETDPTQEGPYHLNHYQVASRLSYFLWASMPDDELFALARDQRLHDDEVLRKHALRLLRDPRSRGLSENFAAQWLGLRPLGPVVRPDAKLFPEFDDELARAMTEETVLCVDRVLREDQSLLELIDADYTYLNERLAALYKIDGVKGPDLRLVALTDAHRGGVLGHAGILTVTSHPHRTSPVLRGKWILETLLGAEVPPPPPNVPELRPKDKEGKALTMRQQLELHRARADCASCHNRMDPLGFGLENYDPLGRWRTELEGKPLDTVGVLPTGEKFDGPAELKKLLLDKRRPEYLRNFSRKLLGYALGRQLNRYDLCVVDACVAALEKGQYRPSRLVETIVVSYPFAHRYQGK
jgi:mono/diheme cytochrome c family protein